MRGPEEDETTNERIPEGWEDRRTPDGRVYYVNHVTRTTQWSRPTQPASASQVTTPTNGQNGTDTVQTPPGPSRSSTMNNIEQSPSNGSLNQEPTPGSRRHSTENLIGTTNGGEISNSSSTHSIENKITALSPTTAASTVSSPRNSILVQNVNTLSTNLSSLAVDTNNTNDASETHQTPVTAVVTPTTNSSSARIVSKTTNLSPTQQQQVPPNTTAPLNGPPRDTGSRSPPTTNLQRNDDNNPSQPGTPQRPAEVIQNRNAADGEFLQLLECWWNFLNHLRSTAQRSRRSARNQDESQRRQRQRQARPVIIGAGIRPNGHRPAIDLPPGYGMLISNVV